MTDRSNSSDGDLGVSGMIGLFLFFAVFIVVMAIPFIGGGYVIKRFFVFGQVQDWARGWGFLLVMAVAFLLWFFLTYLTDKLVNTFCPKPKYKVLNEIAGTVVDFAVGWWLMAMVFVDVRGSFMAALLSIGLSWVAGLALDRVLPEVFGKEKKPDVVGEQQHDEFGDPG